MKHIAIAFIAFSLVGCKSTERIFVRQPVPEVRTVTKETIKYVPIDSALTAKCPWARDVKPSMAMVAAVERRKCLETYESQLDGIKAIQGKAK